MKRLEIPLRYHVRKATEIEKFYTSLRRNNTPRIMGSPGRAGQFQVQPAVQLREGTPSQFQRVAARFSRVPFCRASRAEAEGDTQHYAKLATEVGEDENGDRPTPVKQRTPQNLLPTLPVPAQECSCSTPQHHLLSRAFLPRKAISRRCCALREILSHLEDAAKVFFA